MPTTRDAIKDRVAARLVRAGRMKNGRLVRTGMLQTATRAALLVDLALAGALTDSAHSIEFAETDTGFPAANALLAAVLARPDRTIEWWLEHGPDSADDVVGDLLASGIWTEHRHGLHRRYDDEAQFGAGAERALIAGDDDPVDRPDVACFLALARAAAVHLNSPRPPSDALVRGCGAAAWLVPDLTEFLADRISLGRAVAVDSNATILMGTP